jgi:hypothetical protein
MGEAQVKITTQDRSTPPARYAAGVAVPLDALFIGDFAFINVNAALFAACQP